MDTLCWYSEIELARIRCNRLYFAELFRRGGYLTQLCQASVYEGVREDMYVRCVGWHSDCFCQPDSENGGHGERRTAALIRVKSPSALDRSCGFLSLAHFTVYREINPLARVYIPHFLGFH